jgi:hypothetical protein
LFEMLGDANGKLKLGGGNGNKRHLGFLTVSFGASWGCAPDGLQVGDSIM